ncbi:hypothetical protein [Arthrobacter sp. efr-133-TYG-120]|uniref:hypothetical protein n=1 Tax=Arthrobacter sp. efr-133-TYG-120 TaxID=3040280 RepID=UPI00254C871C|nr:hypothetical protein [Arthrobacter sp. efr-133-TYG-120]
MNNREGSGLRHPEWASAQRRSAAEWYRDGRTALAGVWAYFYGIGGDVDEMAVDAYLHELGELPPSQMNLLALAMRELDTEAMRELDSERMADT